MIFQVINWTYATKAIVSVLGSVSVYLQTPDITWKEGVALLITSILVWLVPNTSNPVTVVTPPAKPKTTITNSEREELDALRAQKAVA